MKQRRRSRKLARVWVWAGAVVLTVAMAAPARAGFTITLDSTQPVGTNTAFNYSATIPVGDQINTGDFFRIYDFGGLVTTPSAPAGWTVTLANSNPPPPPNVILTYGDDPAIVNLTFTYTGAAPILGAITVTGFQAITNSTILNVTKDFVGRDTKSTGPTAGSSVDSVGSLTVPGVPEPSSVISASLGVILIGAAFGYGARRKIRTHAS
jgi:hypothetical protein